MPQFLPRLAQVCGTQVVVHVPLTQVAPAPQTIPQPPQLALSFVMLVSQPGWFGLQSAKPALQAMGVPLAP